jgi:hypothetical protein
MRSYVTILFGLLTALAASPASGPSDAWSQVSSTVVKRAGPRSVVRVASDGSVADTLYTSEAVSVSYLTVSPSGRFLGLLETTDLTSRSHRLVVLDASGDVRHVVPHDAQRYVWCCGGEQLAVITGQYREDPLGYTPTGAYLIDVLTGIERRLEVPEGVYEVTWAPFDGALYFKTFPPVSKVIRYDPGTGTSRSTDYLDFAFSASGAYYLQYIGDPALGRHGWHIYERATGREVPLPDASLGAIEGWVFDEGDYLKLKRVRYPVRQGMIRGPEVIDGYTIYDVARGTVAARIQDSICTDVVAPAGILVLAGDGVLKLVRGPSEIARE